MGNRILKRSEECLHCSKRINLDKDHHVQLHTLNRQTSPDHTAYFHFNCWIDYFNKRVENKMRANIGFMQEKAMGLLKSPMIQSALSGIQGGEMIEKMLQTPLKKEDEKLKTIILNKYKKDGKSSEKGKTRKA